MPDRLADLMAQGVWTLSAPVAVGVVTMCAVAAIWLALRR
jgi:hypothetical protein